MSGQFRLEAIPARTRLPSCRRRHELYARRICEAADHDIPFIASAVCGSPSHLHAIFRNTLGVSPIEYNASPDRRGHSACLSRAPGLTVVSDRSVFASDTPYFLGMLLGTEQECVPDRVRKNTHHDVKMTGTFLPSGHLLTPVCINSDHGNDFLGVESVLHLFKRHLSLSVLSLETSAVISPLSLGERASSAEPSRRAAASMISALIWAPLNATRRYSRALSRRRQTSVKMTSAFCATAQRLGRHLRHSVMATF